MTTRSGGAVFDFSRGTLAVAALPIRFWRRSCVLPAPLLGVDRTVEFAEDDARRPVLSSAKRSDDRIEAFVEISAGRQHRDQGRRGL
jgi:hypothetical protein